MLAPPLRVLLVRTVPYSLQEFLIAFLKRWVVGVRVESEGSGWLCALTSRTGCGMSNIAFNYTPKLGQYTESCVNLGAWLS